MGVVIGRVQICPAGDDVICVIALPWSSLPATSCHSRVYED